jgi:hypothetical protein
MSLLNKFASIAVDPSKSLLKGEDSEAIQSIQNDYLNAFNFFEKEIEFFDINREANRYLNLMGAIENTIERVEKLAESYIRDIVSHFQGKYKIDLNNEEIKTSVLIDFEYHDREDLREGKKSPYDIVKKLKVDLNKILSQIQDKLGGLSLNEKAEQEIKENFYKEFAKPYGRNWRSDKIDPVVEVTKNRVIFERGIGLEATYNGGMRIPYNYEKDLNYLFQALSHFETKQSMILPTFQRVKTWKDYDIEFLTSDIEFDTEKVKSVRFYKNRKMVLKFMSDEIAREFFREWCREGVLVGEE